MSSTSCLQVLDDGRLTDNKGRTVDFRNTIIIMTSNMGSHIIQENFSKDFDGKKVPEEVIERDAPRGDRPPEAAAETEFLNRIDEIVMFEPLTRRDIERIVDIQLGSVRKMLSENGIRLEYTDRAREWIATAGYDPLYGARPREADDPALRGQRPFETDSGRRGRPFETDLDRCRCQRPDLCELTSGIRPVCGRPMNDEGFHPMRGRNTQRSTVRRPIERSG